MKQIFTFLASVLVTVSTFAQVGINNENPDASAALDITSTTGGLLVPRMTETQRNAISPASTGLMVYQTDGTSGFYYYNGSSWTTYYSKNEVDTLIANLQNQLEEQNQNIDNDFDGFSENNGDCDDTNAQVYIGAEEICDGLDNDCDGNIDEEVLSIFYQDLDGDGYGGSNTTQSCTQPTGYVTQASDCDDSDSSINPGAVEVCGDGIDQDCDGSDAVCNTPPVISSITISPDTGLTVNTTLAGSVTVNDADGEVVNPTFEWTADGLVLGTMSTLTLSPSSTPKGTTVVLTASAIDGAGDSATPVTASIIVENTPPTAPIVSISAIWEGGNPVAVLDTPSTDADGDTVSYEYSWSVDGFSTICQADTYCFNTTAGEIVEVIVTPNDGEESGASSSASTYICGEEICGDAIDNDCDGSVDENCY